MDYQAAIQVGDTIHALPVAEQDAGGNTITNAATRFTHTWTTMLDENDAEVPLSIDPGDGPVTIFIRGGYLDVETLSEIVYDSTEFPSSFTVFTGGAVDPTPTETVETSVTPMDPTGDITQEQVEAALLTPEEVAPGLVLGEWTNEDSPPPCDQSATPVDVQIPPSVEAGVEINTADGNASMEEEIAIYATAEEASEAFTLGSAGLDCTTASAEDGSTVTIGPATDVTAEVNGASGLGTSTAWEITGEGFSGVLVATLSNRIVMANTFVVADGADTSTLPTPIEIATTAFAKALAN